jgi:ribosomal-protein-alanine N-acetyltransferase
MKFNDKVFDSFPVLETKRLILREIRPDDVNEVFDIRASEDVMRYFGKDTLKSIKEAEDLINLTTEGFKNKEGIRWGLTLKGTDKIIGSGGIWRILKPHLRGEIGYELSPEHWQKGFMTEAISEMIRFGFDQMNLHTVEANLDPANIASIKLLEKTGFIKEGHIKESYFQNGAFTDTAVYSIIKKMK